MLNKLGKKICAGVCALSLGFSSNVKSDAFVGQLVLATCELVSACYIGGMLKKFGFLKVKDLVYNEVDKDEVEQDDKGVGKVHRFSTQGFLQLAVLGFLTFDSLWRGFNSVLSRGDKKTEEPRLDDKKSNAKINKE